MAYSDVTVYNGTTPQKPQHYFSRNPPTDDPVNQQSLRSYRLEKFVHGPNNVPVVPVAPFQPPQTNTPSHHSAGRYIGIS
ncbi:hypothetical protein F4806DRAFT_499531 [Annulohypoxylon nitens]|nr:hypothetical protein F4806DRAFT_499531 [Annulohypoxylon nitens]